MRPPERIVDTLVATLRKAPETAAQELEALAQSASDAATRIAVYEHLGALYLQLKRLEDAQRIYRAGFDLERASTAIRENFRAALAKVLSQQTRDDEVIALFEHPDRPLCPDASPEGQLALAYAYAEKGQHPQAQAIVDAQLARQADELAGSDDLSPWDKLNMTLSCRANRVGACVQQWERLLRWPFRGDSLTAQLSTEMPRLRSWPEATAMLDRARRDRLVEDDTVRPHSFVRVNPKPLNRVPPRYPRVAASNRIEGRLLLEILIDEDGRVAAVRVIKATPAQIFEKEALAAVKRWTFEPALIDGKPVKATGIQQLDFAMRQR